MPDGALWGQLGPWGLVSTFVMLVLLGYLVPRRIHNQQMADKDKQIVFLQQALDKRDQQFERLVSQNEVVVRLLEDIKGTGHRRSTSRET